MELVALLSSGKGTWGQVSGLISRGEWEKVILICPEFFKDSINKFDFAKNAEKYFFNFDKPIKELVEEIKTKLKDKIQGVQVALNIASGTGKEHMAVISALLNTPVGIKFVVLTKEGIIEL
jgi:hypothetical protein